MISTSFSSTSDYYSGSDLDYDDDDHVVKAAPQHHQSSQETNIILRTLLLHHHPPSSASSTIKLQLSHRLLKLVRDNGLSDESFIRANTILHQYLLSASTNVVGDSILIACLSLSTKLSEHSTHCSISLLNNSSLLISENMVCNGVDWDIDVMTSINYVEAMLLDVSDSSEKDRLRKLSYEMVVLCLTDVDCMNLSPASMGMGCLLMACELQECGEVVRQRLLECGCNKDPLFQRSLLYIGQVLRRVIRR